MPEHADLIVTNARILTMDEGNPRAEAVAIRDGTIAAVGGKTSIAGLAGPATRNIDAGGSTVVPASSKHMHLFAGATELEAADPEQLHEVRPTTTICGGKVTYQV